MKPRMIADYECDCGEGPLWHPGEKLLYWLDIPRGRIFRYDPATGKHEQYFEGAPVGGISFQADGGLLLFGDRGSVNLLRDGALTTVIEEIPEERKTRFNDVCADPLGRVFCGTMPAGEQSGRLYLLDIDGTLCKVFDGAGCSNGIGFTPDRKRMYHTNSTTREIRIYDYDRETGALSNEQLFLSVPEGQGLPDGMTVDAEGYVWSARWGGSSLFRFAPDGTEDMRIEFPALNVSSVMFGGEDYTDIYVTTAGGTDRAKNGPGAGALFHINLGIRGVPEFYSRIKV